MWLLNSNKRGPVEGERIEGDGDVHEGQFEEPSGGVG